MISKKIAQLIVKVAIAALTVIGSYLGASAQVHNWF